MCLKEMPSSTVEFCGQQLSSAEVSSICDSLTKGQVRVLSLRECALADKDYKKLLKVLGACKSVIQLSLSIGIVTDAFRIQILAQMLQKNESIVSLFLHGNAIRDEGLKVLHPVLCQHPRIISLDVGDCQIGDKGLELLCGLLGKRGTRPGLFDLALSGNPSITFRGWTALGLAIASGSNLRSLYLDYNDIGDNAAAALLVAMTASRTLETVDMEGVGVTELTAETLLRLVKSYPVALKRIILSENDISQASIEAIKIHLPAAIEDSDDQSAGIRSDDEQSLATSEPPLEGLTILGATDSPAESQRTSESNFTQLKTPDAADDTGIGTSEHGKGVILVSESKDGTMTGMDGTDEMQYSPLLETADTKITTMTDRDVLVFAKALEAEDSDNFLTPTPSASRKQSLQNSDEGSIKTIEVMTRVADEVHEVKEDVRSERRGSVYSNPVVTGVGSKSSTPMPRNEVFLNGYGRFSSMQGTSSRTSICSDTEVVSRQRKTSVGSFVRRESASLIEQETNSIPGSIQGLDQVTSGHSGESLVHGPDRESQTSLDGVRAFSPADLQDPSVTPLPPDQQALVSQASSKASRQFSKAEKLQAIGTPVYRRRSSTSVVGDVEIEDLL